MRTNLPRLVFLLLLFLATTAQAQPLWSRLVVFGDSLSDPGNAFVLAGRVAIPPYAPVPDAPYVAGGLRFSNGPTWIEQLAQALGDLSAGPALRAPGVFGNYAVGAARARDTPGLDLGEQLALFLDHSGGVAPADALYVIMVGGNDVRDALAALAADASGGDSLAIIQDAVTAVADALAVLAEAGARHVLLANAPDIARVPAIRAQGPMVQWAAGVLVGVYNAALAQIVDDLASDLPLTLHRLDLFGALRAVTQDPVRYGFTDVTGTCVTPGVVTASVCEEPDGHLFWDGIHPTRAGHAVVARAAASSLGLP